MPLHVCLCLSLPLAAFPSVLRPAEGMAAHSLYVLLDVSETLLMHSACCKCKQASCTQAC